MMTVIRTIITIILVLTVIPALLIAGCWPQRGNHVRLLVRRQWVRWILWSINVKLVWKGNVPDMPCILVANHRSYLDPLLILTRILALPVAKAEMAKWPIIGFAGRLSGIFYVQRESQKDRSRTLGAIQQAVNNQQSVLVFPEGTTHAESQLHPFKKGVFQVAAQSGVPIVPIALDFKETSDYWIGSDTFVGHFLRQVGQRRIHCIVHVGEPLRHNDPDHLLTEAREWIQSQLNGFYSRIP